MSEKRKWFGGFVIVVIIIFFAALWIRPNDAAAQRAVPEQQAATESTKADDAAVEALAAEAQPVQNQTNQATNESPEEEIVWYTNYSMAKEKAKKENKDMFLLFHGSDWCVWCIKLDEEVLSKKEFLDWAKDNLILVSLDFPMKTEQDENLRKQNEILGEMFQIEGYPTVVVTNPSGKELFRTGYQKGGADNYIAHLEEQLKAAK